MTAAPLLVERAAVSGRPAFLQRIFSFPSVISSLLAMLAVLTVRSRFDDPDMWWHLRTGQIISTTHAIPTSDIFSYTTSHHAYVPHEWLSQVLIYIAYALGGYTGMMVWLCLFTAALLIAGYWLCSSCADNPKIGFLGALTMWFFATTSYAVRPQLVGYLLLIVELLIIQLGRRHHPRWFFALPPLFALWVNCHGSFFLGLILAGLFLACSFLSFRSGSLVSEAWPSRTRRQFAIGLAASFAALFCNPIGIKQILYPLDTLLHQPLGLSQVEEWMPLSFDDTRAVFLLITLAIILLVVILRRTDLQLTELLLMITATYLAASHRRMLVVFGILVAPVLSRLLSDLWDGYDARRDRPLPTAILIAAPLVIAFFAIPRQAALTRQIDQNSPTKAVEFMKANRLPGPMLNEYRYGGYLIWAAPEYPVFIDGRADVFEWTGVFSEFGQWASLQSEPNALLDKYGVNLCLLARGSPMVTVMSLLKDWHISYQDNNSVIFTRIVPRASASTARSL